MATNDGGVGAVPGDATQGAGGTAVRDPEVWRFVDQMVGYLQTNKNWSTWDPERAVREALGVLTDDIGAAQHFVSAIGLKVDLYTTPLLGADSRNWLDPSRPAARGDES